MSSSNSVANKAKTKVSKGTNSQEGKILVAGPLPINLEVRNFNLKDLELEANIINGLWLPIRKQVRLTENVDIVLTVNKFKDEKVDKNGNPVTVERKNGELSTVKIPGIRFRFMTSMIYDDFNETELDEEDLKKGQQPSVYQELTLREGVEEDIVKVQNDAEKVRMRYILKDKYKKAYKEQLEKLSKGSKLKKMVREMKVPTNDIAAITTETAVSIFRQKLLCYIQVMNENKRAAGFTPQLDPKVLKLSYDRI